MTLALSYRDQILLEQKRHKLQLRIIENLNCNYIGNIAKKIFSRHWFFVPINFHLKVLQIDGGTNMIYEIKSERYKISNERFKGTLYFTKHDIYKSMFILYLHVARLLIIEVRRYVGWYLYVWVRNASLVLYIPWLVLFHNRSYTLAIHLRRFVFWYYVYGL